MGFIPYRMIQLLKLHRWANLQERWHFYIASRKSVQKGDSCNQISRKLICIQISELTQDRSYENTKKFGKNVPLLYTFTENSSAFPCSIWIEKIIWTILQGLEISASFRSGIVKRVYITSLETTKISYYELWQLSKP